MSRKRFAVAAMVVALAFAANSNLRAQVVQQPSFRTTTYSGSVVVPDSGTGFLGGNRYGRTGSVSRGFGPFASRAGGSQVGGNSLTASVQIIDLKAMDEAILSANVKRESTLGISSVDAPSSGGRSYLSGLSADRFEREQTGKPVEHDWQRALAGVSATSGPSKSHLTESQVEADIRYYLRKGKAAEQANRIQAARVFYRMAVDAMTPDMIVRYKKILVDRKAKEAEQLLKNRPDRIKF